jgi:hypothetical protein
MYLFLLLDTLHTCNKLYGALDVCPTLSEEHFREPMNFTLQIQSGEHFMEPLHTCNVL